LSDKLKSTVGKLRVSQQCRWICIPTGVRRREGW